MLKRSALGSHLSQVATPKTASSTFGLVLGGIMPMMFTAPRTGIVASSRVWISGIASGMTLSSNFCPSSLTMMNWGTNIRGLPVRLTTL